MLPEGLALFIACERAEPRDALVLPAGQRANSQKAAGGGIAALAQAAVVGTSSLRRLSQLKHARPDLDCRDLRGNVNTRLGKLDSGQYDAIVLAAAGLQRLGLDQRISALLPVDLMLPAVAQGALAIEYRADDPLTYSVFATLQDPATTLCVAAERALNRHLEGGCEVPIAAFAQLSARVLSLEARVGSVDGVRLLSAKDTFMLGDAGVVLPEATVVSQEALEAAESLGVQVAQRLLAEGAGELLAAAQ